VDEGPVFSNTPCLLMEPTCDYPAPQVQAYVPIASNALALPIDNGIFMATPIERFNQYPH